jgi:transposase
VEAPAELAAGDDRHRLCRQQGAIIQAYTQAVPGRRVLCLDEMGPVSVKTYPSEVWTYGSGRATFTPDYGRRGRVWVLGASSPPLDWPRHWVPPRRDSASFLHLLEQVLRTYPAREWRLIVDHRSTHVSRDTQTALLAWPEIQLLRLPTYACWLTLIEPWWKHLRSLALKGRRFERVGEIIEAVVAATEYWHHHRHPYAWKKAI